MPVKWICKECFGRKDVGRERERERESFRKGGKENEVAAEKGS
jgi:hypothetical protein